MLKQQSNSINQIDASIDAKLLLEAKIDWKKLTDFILFIQKEKVRDNNLRIPCHSN